jgi:hypothetical protein
MRVYAMLYAGNNLRKAQEIFVTTIKHRPDIRLTMAADSCLTAVAAEMKSEQSDNERRAIQGL